MWKLVLLTLAIAGCSRSDQATAPSTPAPSTSAGLSSAHPEPARSSAHHHGPHPLGHRFETAEHWASVFDDPGRDAWQKPTAVVTLMGLSEGNVVADIGAGTGYFLPHLVRAVGKTGTVIGIDVEPDMVRYMGERAAREGWANVEARKAKPDDPSIAPGSVDRILIVNTWHHIPDRDAYSRKLLLALKPRGAVFVVDYTLNSPHGPPRDHRLPADRVVDELSRGGFDASLREEDLPYQYVVVGKKR